MYLSFRNNDEWKFVNPLELSVVLVKFDLKYELIFPYVIVSIQNITTMEQTQFICWFYLSDFKIIPVLLLIGQFPFCKTASGH